MELSTWVSKYVTKKSLKKIHPLTKMELYRFTKAHPEVLDLYKKAERRERASSNDMLNDDVDVSALCDALSSALKAIPTGSTSATDFHNLMIGAIEFIFFPSLMYPKKETPINNGRKRIDITYTNAARDGFFYRLHTARQIASKMVMVECKNYTGDIANPELDQLVGRFSVNRGRLGILVARTCENPILFQARCRDITQAGNGVVIPLFDDDIYAMLNAIKDRRREDIDARLDNIFTRLIS